MRNYKQIILEALEEVISESCYKEVHDMHEVALCHRLAFHLETSEKFTGYLIDCDYNRDEQAVKRDPRSKMFRPDIVVHKRGNGEDNLLMIEAKKYPCSKKQRQKGKERLRRNANAYQYGHAFLVVFPRDDVKKDSVIEVSRE